jgi:hypothetical protein
MPPSLIGSNLTADRAPPHGGRRPEARSAVSFTKCEMSSGARRVRCPCAEPATSHAALSPAVCTCDPCQPRLDVRKRADGVQLGRLLGHVRPSVIARCADGASPARRLGKRLDILFRVCPAPVNIGPILDPAPACRVNLSAPFGQSMLLSLKMITANDEQIAEFLAIALIPAPAVSK